MSHCDAWPESHSIMEVIKGKSLFIDFPANDATTTSELSCFSEIFRTIRIQCFEFLLYILYPFWLWVNVEHLPPTVR